MADGKILAGGDPTTHVGVGASSIAVDLREPELTEIVREKATCPFIGTAVATRRLLVRNEAANPLASTRTSGSSGTPAAVTLAICWRSLQLATTPLCVA
jgi:hypothetical protein